MNKQVSSAQEILSAAKEIAYSQGISQVSIRRTAAACGIAVGTVYHYYADKSDLILAVLRDFWQRLYHGAQCAPAQAQGYLAFCQGFYTQLHQNLQAFARDFLSDMGGLDAHTRQRGRQMEEEVFAHIRWGMLGVLQADAPPAGGWAGQFTPEGLVDFTFAHMMLQLRAGQEDCPFLWALLGRLWQNQ